MDRGSPNTSWVTKEFFEIIGSDLSFARVRRPTDNAITERFYGSIKQEEIYLVANYPDETSAREEIGGYMERHNHHRPHQALMNFTPAYVHQVNNKTIRLQELKILKNAARERRKAFWLNPEQPSLDQGQREYAAMAPMEIGDYRANAEGVVEGEGIQEVLSQTERAKPHNHDSRNFLLLSR